MDKVKYSLGVVRAFRNFEFGRHGAIQGYGGRKPYFYWRLTIDVFRPNAMCSFIGWGYWYAQSVRWRDLPHGRFGQREYLRRSNAQAEGRDQ